MDRVDYETYETQNVYDSVEEEKSALPSEKKVTFSAITLQPNFSILFLTHTPIPYTSQKLLSGINNERKQQDIHCDRCLHLFFSCPWNGSLDHILNDSQQLSKQPTGGQALCSAAKRHGNRKVDCH